MIEIKSKLRKWGNSLGVIIPSDALEEENFREGDEITILLKKDLPNLRKLFGKLKGWRIDTQKFKDERRKEDSERVELLSRHLRND
ncbi:AbrB/MazE/SpoVT family DNA-binding domain-containing protein [Candidatus Pacearchaeota archaeon]|nr:AbrB/MazE/SpoVT family DNA-binding domain-containing protein [Candidatus Pacearchaeota archaeon]